MRRILLTVVAVTSLLIAPARAQEKEIRAITDKLSESLSQAGKKTVAVVDFTDLQGRVTELGRFLAEELSASLAENAKNVELVDRTNLKVIIQENKLTSTGIIDPATARKLGQIAGVDSLITGTLTPFGDTVHLSIKILDTSTARVVGATRGEIPKTKAIEELLGQGIANLGDGPHPQVSPGVRAGSKAIQPSTEVKGILAVANDCRANDQTLICILTVTSQQNDSQLTVGAGVWTSGRWAYTKAFDDSGVEYGSDTVVFAGKTSYPNTQVDSLLVSGVPTQIIVKFNRFSGSSTKVTLLVFQAEVQTASGGWYTSKFELRSIPIQR